MAKEMKPDVKPGNNGYDPEKSLMYIKSVEDEQDKIDAIMAKAKEECEPHRTHMKDIKKTARKDLNVPASVFNGKIRERKLIRKAQQIPDAMNETHQDEYTIFSHAVGELLDTPLGQAAAANVTNIDDAKATS